MNKYLNPITGEMNTLDLENPAPGVYAKVPHVDYIKISAESRSSIANFEKAEERYLYNSEKVTDAMVFGTHYHAYMLEPDVFEKEFHEGTVTKSGARGVDFKADQQEHGIYNVYTPADLQKMKDMHQALSKYPNLASVATSDTYKELTVVFLHKASGLMCKVRIDILVDKVKTGWIIDLKTAADVLERKFRWSVRDFGYDLQSGFYIMACRNTPGLEHVNKFGIIAQEKNAPYMVRAYRMDQYIDDAIDRSNSLLMDLAIWKKAGHKLPDGMIQMENFS